MSELRWYHEGTVHGRPTPTDALEYAEKCLQDRNQFECSRTDARLPMFKLIKKIIDEYKEQQ